jgi:hypothetical protein
MQFIHQCRCAEIHNGTVYGEMTCSDMVNSGIMSRDHMMAHCFMLYRPFTRGDLVFCYDYDISQGKTCILTGKNAKGEWLAATCDLDNLQPLNFGERYGGVYKNMKHLSPHNMMEEDSIYRDIRSFPPSRPQNETPNMILTHTHHLAANLAIDNPSDDDLSDGELSDDGIESINNIISNLANCISNINTSDEYDLLDDM